MDRHGKEHHLLPGKLLHIPEKQFAAPDTEILKDRTVQKFLFIHVILQAQPQIFVKFLSAPVVPVRKKNGLKL